MNFFFKFMTGPGQSWEGPEFAEELRRQLDAANHRRYRSTGNPEQADAIFLVESNLFKERHYVSVLKQEPMLQMWPEKCFAINYEDDALGLLPGIYAGIPRSRFDSQRHRSSCYLHPYNAKTTEKAVHRDRIAPLHLVSFRGALSHPLRRRLLHLETLNQLGPLTGVSRWFDHSEEEKVEYLDEMLSTKFVLCPRGIAPSSFRLFEAMELGRVPVIVSDDWVAPSGVPWQRVSIRVAESRIDELPGILLGYESSWREMACAARQAWEQWFSPSTRMISAAESVEELLLQRPSGYSEKVQLENLGRLSGRMKHGWTLGQRIIRKIRRMCLKRVRV